MFSKILHTVRTTLKTRPLISNMVTYATFYTAADISQQTFKRYRNDGANKPEYNLIETAKIAAVGTTVYAPALTYCYRYLDNKFKGASVRTVLTKLIADQGFMTPVLLAAFYVAMAFVEGRGRDNFFDEMREKYLKSYIANQVFWIPAQTINFAFVPPYLRVVFVAAMSFMWINVLCYIKRQKLTKDLDSKAATS